VRDIAGFDFAAQPALDRAQIRDLATGRFIANGDALPLLGPPGVGKIHLAKTQTDGRLEERADTLREAEAAHRRRARHLPLEPDAAPCSSSWSADATSAARR